MYYKCFIQIKKREWEKEKERKRESIIIITNKYACILLIPNDCFLKLPDVF